MALPALVLVHGGAHASDCWDLTVGEIRRLAPELTVLAVDLPGRRGKPGDLAAVRIADCVDSVIADVESAGLSEVVVCGHSLGGVTVPGVVAKLGTSRVREMVLAAAFLPPQGTSVLPRICGESIHLATEKIDRRQLPDDVRRGYSPAGIVRCLDGSSAGASRACPV